MTSNPRRCPLCGAQAAGAAFPFATEFNDHHFKYVTCSGCSCVYVDPVPDDETFLRMYAKSQYHDAHYESVDDDAYVASARLLRELLPAGARVLDYGCGTGGFLRALRRTGLDPFGVEFDREAADAARMRSECQVQTVDEFWSETEVGTFDGIHLGDVLEHLPDPGEVLQRLLGRLRPGGILFAEGPLEVNPSPVYWFASLFGWTKRMLRLRSVARHPPTHLFRASARQQLAFFLRPGSSLELREWQVYETGWPYTHGGTLRRSIARLARCVATRTRRFHFFGNRFRGFFIHHPPPRTSSAAGMSTRVTPAQ